MFSSGRTYHRLCLENAVEFRCCAWAGELPRADLCGSRTARSDIWTPCAAHRQPRQGKERRPCPAQPQGWELLCGTSGFQRSPEEQAASSLTSHIINLQAFLFPQNATESNCSYSHLSDENNRQGSQFILVQHSPSHSLETEYHNCKVIVK